MEQAVQDILGRIEQSRGEMAELTLELANTYAPAGREQPVAEVVHAWYAREGLASRVVPIMADRANVIARVPGSGTGRSILFNAHLDTEVSGHDYETLMQTPDPNRVGGWRDGDRLFGHTVLNDRHAHAMMMIAARAIQQSGVTLAGDMVLTSVAGETGSAPVDEFQGVRYEGKGLGSSYLVRHGVRADFAVVSETTNFALCWHACGAAYFKVTVRGRNMYTPRLERPGDLASHPNAIVKAATVVQAIEAWAIEFEATRTTGTPCGEVRPKAQVGAIRGGIPYRPNRSSPYCALYVDVRTLPGEDPADIQRSLRAALDETGVDVELDMIMYKDGALGSGVEPLAEAITDAHRAVRGTEPPPHAEPAVVSMWRDQNVFNNAGIPAINFGPSRGSAAVQGTGSIELDDMMDATKMYALITLKIAGGGMGPARS
jgi:acetylornithine deacetylase/succinyl-diaminopimelate desuccinylase-like protein